MINLQGNQFKYSLKNDLPKKYYAHFISVSLLLLCLMPFCLSCSAFSPLQEIRTRAYIKANASNWNIKHEMRHGQLETDLLTSSDMAIEVFAFVGDVSQPFRIITEFKEVNSVIVFNPSFVTVKLRNGNTLKAKGVECEYVKPNGDSQDLQNQSPLKNQIPISTNACYYLFFDYPAPPLEEEFVMYMNNSLMSNGTKVDVPPIYFRKTIRNIYRWGFFQ